MKEKEFFDGFISVKIDPKCRADDLVPKNLRKAGQGRESSFHEETRDHAYTIFKELVELMGRGLEPHVTKVQKVMQKHHALSDGFHIANQEVYKALATLYREHRDYRKQIDPFHPKVAGFMADAMEIYANTNRS